MVFCSSVWRNLPALVVSRHLCTYTLSVKLTPTVYNLSQVNQLGELNKAFTHGSNCDQFIHPIHVDDKVVICYTLQPNSRPYFHEPQWPLHDSTLVSMWLWPLTTDQLHISSVVAFHHTLLRPVKADSHTCVQLNQIMDYVMIIITSRSPDRTQVGGMYAVTTVI